MIIATVTGLSAWVCVAAFAWICFMAVKDYRRICKRDDARRARQNRAQAPELWPWPNRSHKNAPALVEQPRARQARS